MFAEYSAFFRDKVALFMEVDGIMVSKTEDRFVIK